MIEWFLRENISTAGLAEASRIARDGTEQELSEAEQVYGSRQRNLHDVFHVLAGYDRDLRGEAAVLAFTLGQSFNAGIAYLVWNALRAEGLNSPAGRLIRDGYRRGRRAKPLLASREVSSRVEHYRVSRRLAVPWRQPGLAGDKRSVASVTRARNYPR